jgi:hypothetical protein
VQKSIGTVRFRTADPPSPQNGKLGYTAGISIHGTSIADRGVKDMQPLISWIDTFIDRTLKINSLLFSYSVVY